MSYVTKKASAMFSRTIVVLLVLTIAFSYGAHLPASFKKCKKNDTKCLMSAIEGALADLREGNKELGINPLDPLDIKEIHAPGSGSNVKIDQHYFNLKLYGLSASKLKSISFDVDSKCELSGDAITPVLSSVGDYDFKGQLLLIPINSKGFHNTTLYGLNSKIRMTCEKFEKKGKQYLKVNDFKINFKADKVSFFYDKIFDSNDQIATQIGQVLNENSLAIFEDAKPDWELSYGYVFKEIANQIFSKVPLDEVFLK